MNRKSSIGPVLKKKPLYLATLLNLKNYQNQGELALSLSKSLPLVCRKACPESIEGLVERFALSAAEGSLARGALRSPQGPEFYRGTQGFRSKSNQREGMVLSQSKDQLLSILVNRAG